MLALIVILVFGSALCFLHWMWMALFQSSKRLPVWIILNFALGAYTSFALIRTSTAFTVGLTDRLLVDLLVTLTGFFLWPVLLVPSLSIALQANLDWAVAISLGGVFVASHLAKERQAWRQLVALSLGVFLAFEVAIQVQGKISARQITVQASTKNLDIEDLQPLIASIRNADNGVGPRHAVAKDVEGRRFHWSYHAYAWQRTYPDAER